MSRRRTFSDTAVSYGAVGCTQASDVMAFPPQGFRPTYDECRLGSGAVRFDVASTALLTWGVLGSAHLDILDLTDAAAPGYEGLLFTEFGTPILPDASEGEIVYSAEGRPSVSPGQSIDVGGVFAPLARPAAYRVIYVIREDRRVGYAWGTLDDSPLRGEEFFGVEWRQDDSVVAIVRTVTQVAPGKMLRLVAPLIRFRQWILRRQYVRALLPARAV